MKRVTTPSILNGVVLAFAVFLTLGISAADIEAPVVTTVFSKKLENGEGLIVIMEEFKARSIDAKGNIRTVNSGREIEYVFLRAKGANPLQELGRDSFHDSGAMGSGEPQLALIDAGVTSDNVLVSVMLNRGSNTYRATLYPPRDLSTGTAVRLAPKKLFDAPENEPRRLAEVKGSLENKSLTVSLSNKISKEQYRFTETDRGYCWVHLSSNGVSTSRPAPE